MSLSKEELSQVIKYNKAATAYCEDGKDTHLYYSARTVQWLTQMLLAIDADLVRTSRNYQTQIADLKEALRLNREDITKLSEEYRLKKPECKCLGLVHQNTCPEWELPV